jgi:hypothetical protein
MRGEENPKFSMTLFIGFLPYMSFDHKYPVCYTVFHIHKKTYIYCARRMKLDSSEVLICVNKNLVDATKRDKLP